eukprot:363491-Chlamydomonas_euryale.AAC.5
MGVDFGDRACPILTAAVHGGGVPNPGSAAHTATPRSGRSGRPRRVGAVSIAPRASLPSHYIAICRRIVPRCTAAVVEWAMDPTTAPRAPTRQPEAGPDVQIMDVP